MCTELQGHSARGRHLQDILERGERVPEDMLVGLVCEAVSSSLRQGKGLMLAGFPRTLSQAQAYQARMGEPTAVLLLGCCPPGEAPERLPCAGLPSSFSTSCCSSTSQLDRGIDGESPEEEVTQIRLALDSC
ncbi:hypothetical protein CRUP_038006 [Coryphaenoides rupestris]|nr:hypothetical protein CRUP_038006 [Coryphaenoides rupestris]